NDAKGSINSYVGGGSTVTANGDGVAAIDPGVSINASSNDDITTESVIIAISLSIGLAGAASQVDETLDPNVSAYIVGGTINSTSNPVSVKASFTGTSDPKATAGSGSLTGGAFAGV